MMQKATEGKGALDATFRKHMDNCLGCMACMTACPSGVQYDKLIEDTRSQVERNIPRSITDNFFRRLLFATFPYPRRMRWLAVPLLLYQRSGLQRLSRSLGLTQMLPKRLAAMEALLPVVPPRFTWRMPKKVSAVHSGTETVRLRVGMLTGCVQQVFFSHVNAATARVLAAEGCDVVTPENQPCCGALMVHSGLEKQAATMARVIIEMFEREQVDVIAINAAGCGSTMKEYGHLLRDDPDWAERARNFSAKCKDIAEILAQREPVAKRNPLPMRVAYHDACHLRHAQGVYREPRQLLAGIPEVEITEIGESSVCCGSAGVYNLLQAQTAQILGDRKVEHLLATKSDAVVSANPGCLLQLMSGLRRQGEDVIPAFHMVELLDASFRGIPVKDLLQGKKSLSMDAS